MKNNEAVLLVEDEPGVLQTFAEWLASSDLNLQVYQAKDAEHALKIAADNPIDLAILDWNLGTGLNGLDLLEDLIVFQPDIVAILVTGYANLATPLHAMRIGVRDYLDKSQDLTQNKFLESVQRQLQKIKPYKQQKLFLKKLESFKNMVSHSLKLLDSNAAFSIDTNLDSTCKRILQGTFEMIPMKVVSIYQLNSAGVLPVNGCTVLSFDGINVTTSTINYASSYASAISNQLTSKLLRIDLSKNKGQPLFELQSFEKGAENAVLIPLLYESRLVAILELVDTDCYHNPLKYKFEGIAEVYAELVAKTMDQDKARGNLVTIMEKALKLADKDDSEQLTSQNINNNINQAMQETGISSEEIEFLNQVHILRERFGSDALRSSTELLKTIEKMLVSAYGENPK